VVALALVFGRTVGHDFVNYDDREYVYNNPSVTGGLTGSGVVWAFTHGYMANWHPLTWLSHMLDCQAYQLWAGGHHLTSLAIHAATSILLFLLLRRMTGHVWPSAFVAFVFGVHPQHVESVAWVAERKDVLSGLFFVLTLMAYMAYVERPFSMFRYCLVVGVYVLGLASKPMLVTLPFVLLLLDYWPLGRWNRASFNRSGSAREISTIPLYSAKWLLLEKLPLLAVAVASCVITLLVQDKAEASIESFPLSWRISNALVSYASYLGQFCYPAGLAVFYPHPKGTLPAWKVAGAGLLLAAVTCGAAIRFRRQAFLMVGWLWFVGMLVPVIGMVQVGQQAMADRYSYLPQIGLCIALAWGLKEVVGTCPTRQRVYGMLAVVVLGGFAVCAWFQTAYWRNSETLWNRALACTSQNRVAQFGLGFYYDEHGDADQAIAHYRDALAIDPQNAKIENNIGVVLAGRRQRTEALAHYVRALELNPDYVEAHYNLGQLWADVHRWDEALWHYRRALAIEPECSEAHNKLGLALVASGKVGEGIGHFKTALRINRRFAEAYYNLGNALAGHGQFDEAAANYEKALAIKPNYVRAHVNLGNALACRGRLDEAIAEFHLALQIQPDQVDARRNLDFALSQTKNRGLRPAGQPQPSVLPTGTRPSP